MLLTQWIPTKDLRLFTLPSKIGLGRDRTQNNVLTLPGDWDLDVTPIRELGLYQKIEAYIKTGFASKTTFSYGKRLRKSRDLDTTIQLAHRRMGRLIASLKARGCQEHPNWWDNIRVVVGRDGRLVFPNGGTHRLFTSKILSIPKVPVIVVGRHPEWDAFREHVRSQEKGRLYHRLPHPDLVDLGGRYDMGRAELILKHATPPGKVIDIGCRYGTLCHALSEAGFQCVGYDKQKEVVEIGTAVGAALFRDYELHHENVMGSQDKLDTDILLLFNVLRYIKPIRPFLSRFNVQRQVFYSDKAATIAKAKGFTSLLGKSKVTVLGDDQQFLHGTLRQTRTPRTIFMFE